MTSCTEGVRYCAQQVDLAITKRAFAEVDGWLHGNKGHELEQVVLHHVAQGARVVVVARAPLHPQSLVPDDVDPLNVRAVPHGLEDPIGEAQAKDVEHGLLGEEVVDPEDRVLGENAGYELVQRTSICSVVPEGLLDHDPARG